MGGLPGVLERRDNHPVVSSIFWPAQSGPGLQPNDENPRARVRVAAGAGLVLGLVMITGLARGQANKARDPIREAALALQQQGKIPEAEQAWRTYIKAHPSDPEPYAQLALLEAHQEHYKEAIPFYRKALAINPKIPGLRINLGLALFKNGQMKEAIPEFSAALKSVPAQSPDAQRLTILLGMAHYGLADYAAAAPFLKQAASRDPQNLPLRLALAHSCLWSHQFPCVMDTYHEILELNAESAEADMIAGEALDAMKDSEGAIKMFRAAIKANPKATNVHFGLGYLLWTQRVYPEAASEFKAELANDPQHAQSMVYLADSYLQLNQSDVAKPLLEQVLKLDPSQELAHLDLGIIYSDAHQVQEALRELTLAEKAKPDDVNVHWRLGRIYRSLGKKEEARAEFEKASKLNKEVDEDLFRKIAAGQKAPPENAGAPSAPPNQ